MSSTMYYFPLSSMYGNIDRASTKTLSIVRYDATAESRAFGPSTLAQATANQSSASQEYVDNNTQASNQSIVTVPNKATNTGYEFTLRSRRSLVFSSMVTENL